MRLKCYDKLVRDRIPEIIRAGGNDCIARTLDADAYRARLEDKLLEEVAEFRADHSVEELADILEVVYAAAKAWGSTPEEVEAMRMRKREERGGFDERILLECVRENDLRPRKVIPVELLSAVDARRTEIVDEENR